jgi:hypothetical protein
MKLAAGIAAFFLVVSSTPVSAQKAAPRELLRWKGKPAKLYVRNLQGPLEVVGVAAGSEMEIVAVVQGSGDASKFKVEAHAGKNSLTVCALYPTSGSSACGPDGHYSSNGQNRDMNGLAVKFLVKLPRGSALDVEQVNGDIVAKGLAADVEIETVNGRIDVQQESGKLDIETVNGRIDVVTGTTGHCDIETVNGSIEVKLNGGGDVEAETVNGRIEIAGERFDREARKTVGKGGRRVDIETVNGGIRVHQ